MSDPLLDSLRQQLAAGGPVDMAGAVAGLAGADPALGLLSQMLARREQTLEHDLEAREREEGDLEARLRLEADRLAGEARREEEERRQELRRVRLERLRARLEALEDDLAACQARLGDLALALGACPGCWGEDPACRLCRGRGGPGFLTPEPEAFRRLVAPALAPRRPVTPPEAGATSPAERSVS